jgi:hypothetical protein
LFGKHLANRCREFVGLDGLLDNGRVGRAILQLLGIAGDE